MYYNYDYVYKVHVDMFRPSKLEVMSFSSNPYNENDSFKLLQVIT